MKIVILDDEKEIADLASVYLENENFDVIKCFTISQALHAIETEEVNLAILDVMLPDGNGFDVLSKIREKHNFPIIMLTAKVEATDKINGLSLGADDYITKPFLPLELVARVKAQLRRYTRYNSGCSKSEEHILSCAGIVLNKKTFECTLNEKPLSLTKTEFAILNILCSRKGEVVSSEELFKLIWQEEYYTKNNNTITVHIRHLREKMNDSFEKPKYIKTVWGVGYKFEG